MLLLFDAGNRSPRQLIEDRFGDKVPGGGGLFGGVILYSSSKSLPGRRLRKVFAASVRCETFASVNPREDDFANEGAPLLTFTW